MSKLSIGWSLIAVGGVCAAIGVIKFVIIGYYPNEFLPYIILMLIGVGALWVGDRFRRQAAIDAGEGGDE